MEPPTSDRNNLVENIDFKLEFEIEEDLEAELDEFILLSHMNRFHDARELYNECLVDHQDQFLVLLEYGHCLLREYKYKRLIREVSPFQLTDPKERAVIHLMRLIAEHASGIDNYNHYRKNLEQDRDIASASDLDEEDSKYVDNEDVSRAFKMARTLSSLWEEIDIDLFSSLQTDAEIQFVNLYLQSTYDLSQFSPNLHESQMSLTPQGSIRFFGNSEKLPLIELGDFIYNWCSTLIEVKRFWDAQCLLPCIWRGSLSGPFKALITRFFGYTETEAHDKHFKVALLALIQWLLIRNGHLYQTSFRSTILPEHQSSWDLLEEALAMNHTGLPSTDRMIYLAKYFSALLKLDLKLAVFENIQSPSQLWISERNVQGSKRVPRLASGYRGNLEEIRSFIRTDGDVNLKDEFDRPLLHLLSEQGNEDAIRLLLEAGAELEAQDLGEGTALHRAMHCKSNSKKVARLLLDEGLRLDTTDNSGRTALDWAEESDLVSLALLLREDERESFVVTLSDSQFERADVNAIRQELALSNSQLESVEVSAITEELEKRLKISALRADNFRSRRTGPTRW